MNDDKIQKRSENIIHFFDGLVSWEQRYRKIIQMGKETSSLDEKYKTKERLVKGCRSQVWLYAYQDPEEKVIFQSDSDALITKGLAALLVQFYSGLLPLEIMQHSRPHFLEALDLQNHLTPTRVGGLFSMIRQIQYDAQVFLLLKKAGKQTFSKLNINNRRSDQ